MTIKIYGSTLSPFVGRVVVTLLEKDVTDFEMVALDMKNKEHNKPPYLEMQPFGQIPVIVDGDLTLFESRAIARYIAHKYADQGTPLYGSTPKDKALVEQWMEVEGQTFHPRAGGILQETFKPLRGEVPDQAVLEAHAEKLGKILDVYEAHLSKSKYLAGDFVSLADITHLPAIFALITYAKRDVLEGRPHAKAWWEAISTRPAWQKVAKTIAEGVAAMK